MLTVGVGVAATRLTSVAMVVVKRNFMLGDASSRLPIGLCKRRVMVMGSPT
jgi:hypothetical protein